MKKKPIHKTKIDYKLCVVCGKKCKNWFKSQDKYFCSIEHVDQHEAAENSS